MIFSITFSDLTVTENRTQSHLSQQKTNPMASMPQTGAACCTLCFTEPNFFQIHLTNSLTVKKHTLKLLCQEHNRKPCLVCHLHIYFRVFIERRNSNTQKEDDELSHILGEKGRCWGLLLFTQQNTGESPTCKGISQRPGSISSSSRFFYPSR